MPKNETKILVIVLLIIDVISIGSYLYFLSYTKSLITESINKENEIKTELKIEETRDLMKGDLILSKMYEQKLADYIVPAGDTVEFIKTLEQLVADSGLKSNVKSVLNEPYIKGDVIGAELLKIGMEVTGEWKNVQFFLLALENYPLKIDINAVSLNKFSDYIVKGKTVPEWSGSFEFTVVKIKN